MMKGAKPKRVDVTAAVTVNESDRDLLLAAGFKPIVRWVDERSDIAVKTVDALAIIHNGRAARRVEGEGITVRQRNKERGCE
jgi:hypothetical protein